MGADVAVAGPEKLYWSDNNLRVVKRSNLDGSQVETILSTGEDISYLTASRSLGKLFYAVGSPTPQLWSADFDGQNRQLLATFNGANYVRGLDFDDVSQRLFWTSSHGSIAGNGKVRSANANGSGVQDVLALSELYPYGMAIDSDVGKMFWANSVSEDVVVQANLDGTSQQTVVGPASFTSQLAVDSVANKVYWTDNESQSVRWSNYDGTQMAPIGSISMFSFDSGIAVDHASGYLFWGDTFTDVIYRANLDGSNPTAIVTSGVSYPISMLVVTIPEPASALLFVGSLLVVAGKWMRRRM
jgi:sugar lactone lactonase YvrE